MKSAGIIIYHVNDTSDFPLILIGTEGKYLSDTNPYIRHLEKIPLNSDPNHYCLTMAKKLSTLSNHKVHVNKLSDTPRFVHITPRSKQGIIKGGMDMEDQHDILKTISREMMEEIGISIMDGIQYLHQYDNFTLFSLQVDENTKQKIEEAIRTLELNYQGELFHTAFVPFDQIEWNRLNQKSKKALHIFQNISRCY